MALATAPILQARLCHGGILRQVQYSQGGYAVGKLTRSYVRANLDNDDLFAAISGAASFSYRDPDTQHTVDLLVVVDPHWNRIVWSTSYEGETQISDFGEYGSGTGQMDTPSDLAIGSNGRLFVADTANKRVIVFAWTADCTCPAERFYGWQFTIPEGDFTHPDQVLWDDNGTPATSTDDIVWVLDTLQAKIAAYHIGSTSSSPYVAIDLNQLFPGPARRCPTAFTKARAVTGGPATTYCTEDLVVYDAANACFLRLSVPHTTGAIQSPGSVITLSTVPGPTPHVLYSRLATDALGNTYALDRRNANVVKFSPNLQYVGIYGSPGLGGFGSQQMMLPSSLAFSVDAASVPSGYQLGRHALLGELWSDASGVQALEIVLELMPPTITHEAGTPNVQIAVHASDANQMRVRIINAQTGATVRTVADQSVSAGDTQFTWDGRNDAGVPVPQCVGYVAEARGIGMYGADTVTTTSAFYYKPRIQRTLTVTAVTAGTQFKYDGTNYVSGGTVALPCSLCTSHQLSVAPSQALGGVRYCFDRWSDDGSRNRAISLTQDTNLMLYLASGPGPPIPPGGTVVNEAFDCKSPYIFQGNASLTKNADWDSFRTQGSVTFRFPHATGGQTRAQLGITIPFVGHGVTFETIDSSATQTSNLWEGIRITSGGTFDCDSCRICNTNVGITAPLSFPARSLRLRRSYLDYNKINDVNVAIDSVGNSPVSLFKNRFNAANAVKLTVGGSVITPHASAVIDSNVFAAPAGGSGALNMVGAWSGYINRNTFYIPNSNTVGIQLDRYTVPWNFGWPVFALHENKFIIEGNNGRFALVAPNSEALTINAENNDWGGAYNAVFNSLVIKDCSDEPQRACVDFDPFIIPAGGGGGGGCPFVLSQGTNGYEVENSILGGSELVSTAGEGVRDAVVLRHVEWTKEPIRLRIAELESEVDEIDYTALGVVKVGEGEEVGIGTDGSPVVFRRSTTTGRVVRWSGRSQPFVSPIAPVDAYRGEPGDSLELRLDPAPGTVIVRGGRIAISMVPKPAPPKPGGPAGVTVRVSYEADGETWISVPAVFPREAWTTQVLSLGDVGGKVPLRVRIVWNSRHTLGWAGMVEARPAEVVTVAAPRSALHSSGHDVLVGLSREDEQSIRILPGEHLDLEFASPEHDPSARLVFLTRGRYRHLAGEVPGVPAVAYLTQNRPNPFNPSTEIRFGFPAATRTSLRVFGVSGRLVATLVDDVLPGGNHIAHWDGRDSGGRAVSSGVYFYQVDAGDLHERRRMVLLR